MYQFDIRSLEANALPIPLACVDPAHLDVTVVSGNWGYFDCRYVGGFAVDLSSMRIISAVMSAATGATTIAAWNGAISNTCAFAFGKVLEKHPTTHFDLWVGGDWEMPVEVSPRVKQVSYSPDVTTGVQEAIATLVKTLYGDRNFRGRPNDEAGPHAGALESFRRAVRQHNRTPFGAFSPKSPNERWRQCWQVIR